MSDEWGRLAEQAGRVRVAFPIYPPTASHHSIKDRLPC